MKSVTFKNIMSTDKKIIMNIYVTRHIYARLRNIVGYIGVSGQISKIDGEGIVYIPAYSKCQLSLRANDENKPAYFQRFAYSEEKFRSIVDNYYLYHHCQNTEPNTRYSIDDYFDSCVTHCQTTPQCCVVDSLSVFAFIRFLDTCSEYDKANMLIAPKVLNSIVHCIQTDLKAPWCTEQVAKIIGVSKAYLNHELKRENITFKQLLNTVRLKHSVSLILSGVSIKKAATESGFNCQNYFSRAFSKHYGHNPSCLVSESKLLDMDGMALIMDEY